MPKWNLPPIERPKKEEVNDYPLSSSGFPDVYDRQIRVPVNSAIIKALTVGGEATVTLRGKISELSSNESMIGNERTMLTIELEQVEAYGAEDPAESMEKGFKKGPRSIINRGY
jgi:hypothetical protein